MAYFIFAMMSELGALFVVLLSSNAITLHDYVNDLLTRSYRMQGNTKNYLRLHLVLNRSAPNLEPNLSLTGLHSLELHRIFVLYRRCVFDVSVYVKFNLFIFVHPNSYLQPVVKHLFIFRKWLSVTCPFCQYQHIAFLSFLLDFLDINWVAIDMEYFCDSHSRFTCELLLIIILAICLHTAFDVMIFIYCGILFLLLLIQLIIKQ